MRKFLGILLFIVLFNSSVFAGDKFVGKWISEETNSVFEIKLKEDEYVMYLLYSGRFFKFYENEIDGKFKKKGTSFKGFTLVLDEDYNNFQAKSNFKIKKGKLIITTKGKYPITNKKFKFKTIYRKFTQADNYIEGEELFGIKIGDDIKEYKVILRNFNIGNDRIGYKPALTVDAPDKKNDFGTYVVRVNHKTNQIFSIRGYLKSNSANQSYSQCRNAIDPYRNYVLDKYANKYLVADYNAFITKNDKIGSRNKVYTFTDHFKFYDKKYREKYTFYAGCFEGDVGQHVGYIGITHNDLDSLDWRTKKEKVKKKEF